MRILLVEDEQTIAITLRDDLEDAGHEVVLCTDGGAAIACLRRQRFDFVITDLRLPGVDGLGVLQAVRRDRSDAGVLVMTAFATAECTAAVFRHGADDFVVKPFLNRDVITRLERIAAARSA